MPHSKGRWEITPTSEGKNGVRNMNGLICILIKPFHFAGQDERYKVEMEEYEANGKLIISGSELLETCIKLQNRLETLIDMTPTGDFRNELTQDNIEVLTLIQKTTHED